MSSITEQKEVQKETTTDESYKGANMAGASLTKLMEYFKESSRIAVDVFSDFIIEILHALGIYKHVVVEFDYDNTSNPLRTTIWISESLKKEWGDNKIKEFMDEFYEYALDQIADFRMTVGGKPIDSVVLAVNEAVFYVGEAYEFDAIIDLPYNNAATKIEDYRVRWILVKK